MSSTPLLWSFRKDPPPLWNVGSLSIIPKPVFLEIVVRVNDPLCAAVCRVFRWAVGHPHVQDAWKKAKYAAHLGGGSGHEGGNEIVFGDFSYHALEPPVRVLSGQHRLFLLQSINSSREDRVQRTAMLAWCQQVHLVGHDDELIMLSIGSMLKSSMSNRIEECTLALSVSISTLRREMLHYWRDHLASWLRHPHSGVRWRCVDLIHKLVKENPNPPYDVDIDIHMLQQWMQDEDARVAIATMSLINTLRFDEPFAHAETLVRNFALNQLKKKKTLGLADALLLLARHSRHLSHHADIFLPCLSSNVLSVRYQAILIVCRHGWEQLMTQTIVATHAFRVDGMFRTPCLTTLIQWMSHIQIRKFENDTKKSEH